MTSRFGFARPLRTFAVLAIVASFAAGCLTQATVQTSPAPTDQTATLETPVATLTLAPVLLPSDAPVTDGPGTPLPTAGAPQQPDPLQSPWLPSGSPLPPTQTPITLSPSPPPTQPVTPPPSQPPTTEPSDPTAGLVAVATGNSRPTRVAVPALHIDLPVIKSNPLYPKCYVAQYLTNFVNPGQPGTTYMYAHARSGMFLPLLTQSQINNGAGMIGMLVKVWTADTKLHLYRINIVKRHALDFSLAFDLRPGQHRLILQTSEGPHGTIPKLQVAAKPIGVYASTAAQALPTPHPVTCG